MRCPIVFNESIRVRFGHRLRLTIVHKLIAVDRRVAIRARRTAAAGCITQCRITQLPEAPVYRPFNNSATLFPSIIT